MAEPMRKDVKPHDKPRDKKKDKKSREAAGESRPQEPGGYPGEMKALGESISGTQPEIGHKDTGVGRRLRERPEYPPTAP